jgi:hypothetical protein
MYLVYIQVIDPFKVVLVVFVGPTKQIQSLYIISYFFLFPFPIHQIVILYLSISS